MGPRKKGGLMDARRHRGLAKDAATSRMWRSKRCDSRVACFMIG